MKKIKLRDATLIDQLMWINKICKCTDECDYYGSFEKCIENCLDKDDLDTEIEVEDENT